MIEDKEQEKSPAISGAFENRPNQKVPSPSFIINSFNSSVFFYPAQKLVVKQRRWPWLNYGSLQEALEDVQRVKTVRNQFDKLMPADTPPEVLPGSVEVISNPPPDATGSTPKGAAVSWVSAMVENPRTLSSLSLKEIFMLPDESLKIMQDINRADAELLKLGKFMDVFGSDSKHVPIHSKLWRWWFVAFWSKNIVISETDGKKIPRFIDREGINIEEITRPSTRMRVKLHPLRLKLSNSLLGVIRGIKSLRN